MPKYTFKCGHCDHTQQLFASVKRLKSPCEKCGEYMDRQMPVLSGHVQVKETVDKLTNRKWVDNQTDILSDRKDVHFWSKEVPKLVASGTYSMETMLENSWVYYDEKGQLKTRTKPPRGD